MNRSVITLVKYARSRRIRERAFLFASKTHTAKRRVSCTALANRGCRVKCYKAKSR